MQQSEPREKTVIDGDFLSEEELFESVLEQDEAAHAEALALWLENRVEDDDQA